MRGFTQDFVAAHQAKNFPQTVAASASSGSESDLHQQVIDCCRNNLWLPFHGSMAHRTYRTPGEPDFTILLPRKKFLLLELKTKTGKLSAEQLGLHMMAENLGHTIHVCRSFSEFLELSNKLLLD
jgi:hypothetical protein